MHDERITSAAHELTEVSDRLQAAANALRQAVWPLLGHALPAMVASSRLSARIGAWPVQLDLPAACRRALPRFAPVRHATRPFCCEDQARQFNERWRTIVFMSNLIAKIRHWLHLDKKPKT
jgi:hypothetical protein